MEPRSIQKAVRELRGELVARGFEHSFRIISGSMRPLLNVGDEIGVKKAAVSEVRVGDIIVWRSSHYAVPLVVHRVICKQRKDGEYRCLTKGDSNLLWDNAWVNDAAIAGKVVSIRKGRFVVRIDSLAGKLAGCILGLGAGGCLMLLTAVGILLRPLRRCFPGKRCMPGPESLLFRSGAGSTLEDWLYSVEKVSEYFRSEGELAAKKVADIHIGGGFSEEALALKRTGVSVDSVAVTDAAPTGYDYVIAARVFDGITDRGSRIALLKQVYCRLLPKGCLVLSLGGGCGAGGRRARGKNLGADALKIEAKEAGFTVSACSQRGRTSVMVMQK